MQRSPTGCGAFRAGGGAIVTAVASLIAAPLLGPLSALPGRVVWTAGGVGAALALLARRRSRQGIGAPAREDIGAPGRLEGQD